MTPARMVELLDGQATVIDRLTAELAEAEAERLYLAGTVARLTAELTDALTEADENAELLTKWAWIARWIEDNACAEPGAIDIALEAWSDMRDNKGNR